MKDFKIFITVTVGLGVLLIIGYHILKATYPYMIVTDYEIEGLSSVDWRYKREKEPSERIVYEKLHNLKGHSQEEAFVVGILERGERHWVLLNPLGWKKIVVHPNDHFSLTKKELGEIVAFYEPNEAVLHFLKSKLKANEEGQ